MKKNYELLFILPGTLTEDEVVPNVAKVKSVLESGKAENIQVTDMGKNRLAYPIKHIRYGYFEMARFEADSLDVVAISNKLRLMPELLRTVVKTYNPKKVSNVNKIVYTIEDVLALPRRDGESRETVKEVYSTRETVSVEASPVVGEKAEEPVTTKESVEKSVESISIEKKVEEKPAKATRKSTKKTVDLADIDKKLDQILDIDISNV
ncbi:MAG TPA: 30S ribosomal protein S6 [Candidatus Magasanikbacteria bacterium]|nr:30S ribosomal protein S6 [Candidatus Magasanikbacteria bacterium]